MQCISIINLIGYKLGSPDELFEHIPNELDKTDNTLWMDMCMLREKRTAVELFFFYGAEDNWKQIRIVQDRNMVAQ